MGDRIRKILMGVFSLIAVLCGAYLIWYYIWMPRENMGTAEEYEEYKIESNEETPEAAEPVEIPIDFASLQAQNPEVCAWIRIEDTHIDYPIVQSRTDEEFYLEHSWEGNYSPAGAIFIQTYNAADFTDYNTVIYGHRMGNGNETMFHDVHNYMDMVYLKSHQNITVYTRDHIRSYKVFAAVVYDDRLIPVSFDFSAESGRQAFLDSLYASEDVRNQFAEGVEVTPEDRIITLSTCLESEPHHRFLLGAVLVDEK